MRMLPSLLHTQALYATPAAAAAGSRLPQPVMLSASSRLPQPVILAQSNRIYVIQAFENTPGTESI